MKTLLLSLLLLISTDPRQIAKINSLKKEAAKEFSAGNYESAIKTYQLLDSMGVEDPALKLNLAHAYYNIKDTTGAISNYQSVLTAPDKKLRSIAYQQLGVMKKETKKYEESLQDLKSSLKADPTNEGARFDYELVKKLLKEQQEQEQNDENQDQENEEEQENEENQDQEQENQDKKEGDEKNEEESEEGEEQESDEEQEGEKKEEENKDGEEQEADQEPTPEEQMQEKLEEMNISPEKAQMILEAMRNNEVQYLQQQKRKATKRPPSGKPDW